VRGAKKVTEETEINAASAEHDPAAGPSATDELAAVQAERDHLLAERSDLRDQLLRAQAEFQNFRKRMEREKVELSDYAATETLRALVPILDDFARSLKVETADREYAKGVELIYQRLTESLKRLGLEPIVSSGQPFDPHIHHAVEMVEIEGVPDNTVLEEYQRGYNFKGRLLRAAMVKVAVAPASK
jgi:molecular chaperone GrpE